MEDRRSHLDSLGTDNVSISVVSDRHYIGIVEDLTCGITSATPRTVTVKIIGSLNVAFAECEALDSDFERDSSTPPRSTVAVYGRGWQVRPGLRFDPRL